MLPIRFQLAVIALIAGPLTAQDLKYDIVPLHPNAEYSFQSYSGSNDPFAFLDDPVDLARRVEVTPANLLDPGDWWDVEASLLERFPKWSLPPGARFLYHKETGLLYAAAPPEVFPDLRVLAEDYLGSSPKFIEVRHRIIRAPKQNLDLQLLVPDDPGVETLVALTLPTKSGRRGLIEFETGEPREVGWIRCSARTAATIGNTGTKVEFNAEIEIEARLADDETFLARNQLSGSATSGDFSEPRVLADSAEHVYVLFIEPRVRRVDPASQLPPGLITKARERWQKIGPTLLVEEEDDPAAAAEVLAGADADGMTAVIFRVPRAFVSIQPGGGGDGPVDPFADLPSAPAKPEIAGESLSLPSFRSTLEFGKLREVSEILVQEGVQFEKGACAIYNIKTGRLFVRNTPSNLDLVEAYMTPLGSGLSLVMRIRGSWIERHGADEKLILQQVSVPCKSGQRAKSEVFGQAQESFTRMELDPVMGADGHTVDLNLIPEYRGVDHFGAPLFLKHVTSSLQWAGFPVDYPLVEIGSGDETRQFDWRLEIEKIRIADPYDFPSSPRSLELSRALARIVKSPEFQAPKK